MKIEFEAEDRQALVQDIVNQLKPFLSNKKENFDEIFDINELAKYIKSSVKWIYDRVHYREIPFRKIKGLLRFRKSEIDKWLEES